MRIFISWSGDRSHAVAVALKGWLRDVFQDLHVWMSSHDIQAGSRWGADLGAELEQTDFGVLCLTAENVLAPWILYEAGSLAKTVKAARVVPYLLGLKPTDLTGPLAQFHGVVTDREGTYRLLESINGTRSPALEPDRLQRLFEKWWPDLEDQLRRIPAPSRQARTDRAIIEELLERVRSIDTRIPLGPAEEDADLRRWPRLPLMGPREIVGLSDEALERYKAELNALYMQAELGTDEENAVLPVLIEAEEEWERRMLGYHDMDEDAMLRWLGDANLDRGTLLRIRKYEAANLARKPVLEAVDRGLEKTG